MLSKLTTDQIRKESKNWALSDCDTMTSIAYREGAEKWAIWKEKAEGLADILEELLKYKQPPHLIQKATSALEQFK